MFKQHKVSIKNKLTWYRLRNKNLKKRTPLHKGSTLFYLFLGVNRFRYWSHFFCFGKDTGNIFVVSEA